MSRRKKAADKRSERAAPHAPTANYDYGLVGLALILVATFVVYWPARNGAQLWDDNAHITKPELQSLQGLARIWFEPGATQQYYPLLHSAFWVEHKLWGDAVLGYHVLNVTLAHARGQVVVPDPPTIEDSGSAPRSGNLRLASRHGRIGRVDQRAEEYALGGVLPGSDACLSRV